MTLPLAVLDLQHRGKPSHLADRGAIWPQGADLAHVQVEEVDLTHRYAIAADHALRLAGWDCVLLSDGTYSDRWARADGYGATVYVALHANAGGGDRGEVWHDHRSSRGLELARHVADALRGVVPWPCMVKAARPMPGVVPAPPEARTWATIHGVGAVALCLEPGFLDCPVEAHRLHLLAHVDDIGTALARGIVAWGKR